MSFLLSKATDTLKGMSVKGEWENLQPVDENSSMADTKKSEEKGLQGVEVERAGTLQQVSSIYQSGVEKVPEQVDGSLHRL